MSHQSLEFFDFSLKGHGPCGVEVWSVAVHLSEILEYQDSLCVAITKYLSTNSQILF